MKIVTVIGARPQFIKAAVVSREFAAFPFVKEIIIHTGQHFDSNMSGVFFQELCIPQPHRNLNINSLSHGAMTGQMLEGIEKVLMDEKPDWVMVYGDTNSTIAGALAAKKLHIKVAHIEAGLRSFNIKMPEEVNRILTDRISDLLFCPTDKAMNNLHQEGYEHFKIKMIKSGDVMLDAARFYGNKSQSPPFELPGQFILCTIHRSENTDDPVILKNIFEALESISKRSKIVLPLHPRTKNKLIANKYNFKETNINFISPVGYLEMVWLLQNCEMVITDSGGLQKEAFFFKKNCITLRQETEWVELVQNGYNYLAGTEANKIMQGFNLMKGKKINGNVPSLYGNGDAGKLILKGLLNY